MKTGNSGHATIAFTKLLRKMEDAMQPTPDLAKLSAELLLLAIRAKEPASGYSFSDEQDLMAAWSILRGVKHRQALKNPHEPQPPLVTR
jgi:hypothetical protein